MYTHTGRPSPQRQTIAPHATVWACSAPAHAQAPDAPAMRDPQRCGVQMHAFCASPPQTTAPPPCARARRALTHLTMHCHSTTGVTWVAVGGGRGRVSHALHTANPSPQSPFAFWGVVVQHPAGAAPCTPLPTPGRGKRSQVRTRSWGQQPCPLYTPQQPRRVYAQTQRSRRSPCRVRPRSGCTGVAASRCCGQGLVLAPPQQAVAAARHRPRAPTPT
jgi:hypothetical protein